MYKCDAFDWDDAPCSMCEVNDDFNNPETGRRSKYYETLQDIMVGTCSQYCSCPTPKIIS